MDPTPGTAARPRRAGFPAPRSPRDDRAPRPEMVVACVDGSASSVAALVWAFKYALGEGCGLLVLTAWPLGRRPFVREVPGHFNEARWEAQEAQARTIAHARSMVDEVPPIETELVNAAALDAVVAAAVDGNLVVLGTDRSPDDAALPAGTASLTVRAEQEATGPVILVPVAGSRPPYAAPWSKKKS